MTIGSGLGNQVGIAPQLAYDTFVAPTRFHEFNSEEFEPGYQNRHSRSIADEVERDGRDRQSFIGGSGSFDLDVMNKGMGILFMHAFGANSIAQVGGTAEYKQTITKGAVGAAGNYLSFQIGIADVGGTVRPFNFVGGKCLTWELSQALDENLKLRTTWDFHSTEESTALGTASYPASLSPLAFEDAAITIGGVGQCVQALTLRGARALAVDRRCLGNTKREPIANGPYTVGGELEVEFEDMDLYEAWKAGTEAALVATWSYGTIPTTSNPFKLVFTIPLIRYAGSRPKSNGSDLNRQTIPFAARYNGSDQLFTVEYHSSDTAI